jgi:hypothetical protein
MTTGEKRQPKETRWTRYELLAWRDRYKKVKEECERLKIALHDAIKKPMGVVPESAEEFYDADFWVDGFDDNKGQK